MARDEPRFVLLLMRMSDPKGYNVIWSESKVVWIGARRRSAGRRRGGSMKEASYKDGSIHAKSLAK